MKIYGRNIYADSTRRSSRGMSTPRQLEYILGLQESLGWSDRELADRAREAGIVVAVEGGSAVLKRLTARDASELIDLLGEMRDAD